MEVNCLPRLTQKTVAVKMEVGINNYYYYNCFTALCPGLPGVRKNIHPSTYPDHHPIFISFFRLLRIVLICRYV